MQASALGDRYTLMLDVQTGCNINAAELTAIDTAIQMVSDERAKLGAKSKPFRAYN